LCLLRLSSTGEVQNRFVYNQFDHYYHSSNSLIECDNGDFVIGGYSHPGSVGDYDAVLQRTSASGTSEWNRSYGGTERDEIYSVVECRGGFTSGGYALTGCTESYGAGYSDYWLVRTDEDGTHMWNRTFGGGEWDTATVLVGCEIGGFALAGRTSSFGAGSSDCWLVRTNDYGFLLWNRTFGGPGMDLCWDLTACTDGGFALVGETNYQGSHDYDVLVIRADAQGNLLWNRTFGGANSREDEGVAIVECSAGGFLVCGSKRVSEDSGYDIWVLRLSSTGEVLWEFTYGDRFTDYATSAIECSSGGFLISGISERASNQPASISVFIRILDAEPTFGTNPDLAPLFFIGIVVLITIVIMVALYLVSRRLKGRQPQRERKSTSATRKRRKISTSGDYTPPSKPHCLACGAQIATDTRHCPNCRAERLRCMVCNQFVGLKEPHSKCPYCGGLAHTTHLLEWLKVKGICPICRTKLRPSKLVSS
jgi:hypothetical protein